MMNKKLTNVIALEMVLAMKEVQANQELVAKLELMKAQFEKKNKSGVRADGTKILTAEQKKNEIIKEQLIEVLARCEEPQQIKDLMRMEEFSEYSNQKLSALLKQLVTAEKVERVEDKKIAKFKIK